MNTSEQIVLRDLVLVGGGHSHVVVLRHFAMNPVPGVRLTLICRDTHTPYSGMLPGYVAGHYEHDDVHIDLRRLAAFAGARFYSDDAIGLDRANKRVVCRHRPPVPYDVLSINIGSTPSLDDVPGAREHAVPVKPINRFNAHFLAMLERARQHSGRWRLAVVGGGAGGVELLLALQHRLNTEMANSSSGGTLECHLFQRGDTLLPTHNGRVRRRFQRILEARKVIIHQASDVTDIEAGLLHTSDGAQWPMDEILWVTQAAGAAWLQDTGLRLDEKGFIQVTDTLQTLDDPDIFAAGDIATMVNHPREKAGVFAVRQGKPLAINLRHLVQGEAPRSWYPQKRWLALISTGDRYAVASRGLLCFAGGAVWRWKDWIDRRFMTRFRDLPEMQKKDIAESPVNMALPLSAEESAQAISAIAMRCGGCGAKVGSTVLSRALNQLQPIMRDDVLIGLHAPDDAAAWSVPPDKVVVHSVDFFRAFIDDPFVFGQVAANHSLGDIFAMGAQAQTATAIVTLPYGLESKTEDVLYQMMSGAIEVLNEAGCALVGGHTGEGKEQALGFAINGLIDPSRILSKGGMQPGNAIVLTKPLGTGTLFAAYPRLAAKGRWIDAALSSMVVSNRLAAQCLHEHGATACTDVTGFGLLGHLVEMARPSGVDAEIWLSALPILPGAEKTAAAGILSSLQPANVRLRRGIRNQAEMARHPRYPLIFDPQTAGGLLATLPAAQADACVARLHAMGYEKAVVIGRAMPQGDALEPIVLCP